MLKSQIFSVPYLHYARWLTTPPRSIRQHLLKEEIEEWQEVFNRWVDRCAKKIRKREVDPDELKEKAAVEFSRLLESGVSRPRALWQGSVEKDLASIGAADPLFGTG